MSNQSQPAADLTGWDDNEIAAILSARDQIASDRRCGERPRCKTTPTYLCECLRAAARRVGNDIMEREYAARSA